jgi:hypothetical protein
VAGVAKAPNGWEPTLDHSASVHGPRSEPREQPLTLTDRGNLRSAHNDEAGATADYDTAIRLAPAAAEPLINRGRIALFHGGRSAAAAEDLAKGAQLAPDNIYAVLSLHIARSRNGTPDREELAANTAKIGRDPWPTLAGSFSRRGNAGRRAPRRRRREGNWHTAGTDLRGGLLHRHVQSGEDGARRGEKIDHRRGRQLPSRRAGEGLRQGRAGALVRLRRARVAFAVGRLANGDPFLQREHVGGCGRGEAAGAVCP